MARAPKTAPETEAVNDPIPNIRFLDKTFIKDEAIGDYWSTRIALNMGPQGDYAGPQDLVAPEAATDEELAAAVATAWGLSGTLTVLPVEVAAE